MDLNEHMVYGRRIETGKYYGTSILALLIWSTSFIGTKIAYSTFPPIILGVLRFVIASFVLGIALFIKKKFVKPTLKDLGIMMISGILGITLYFALENTGVSLTTASNAAMIVASYPAMTTLLEFILYKIKPSGIKVFGILIAMIGVFILAYTGGDNSVNRNQFIGNLILIATGIVWAFYNFTTQKVVNKYPAVTVSFFQTIAGTLCFIPLSLVERKDWHAPTFMSFFMLLYLGVFCSVIAFLLYNYGLRKLSSNTAVSLMNLVPIFGVVFSFLILHEAISLKQLTGGGIVIAGVFLSAWQIKPLHIKIQEGYQMIEKNNQKSRSMLSYTPDRCVIIMDKELKGGHLANAIAVIALTVGQRHPVLIGEPLIDASGFVHPGLIPTGIPMLCASQTELVKIHHEAIDDGCDVVDFPMEGQQTKSYPEFMEKTAQIPTEKMKYTGIALIGQKKTVSKIVNKLELIR